MPPGARARARPDRLFLRRRRALQISAEAPRLLAIVALEPPRRQMRTGKIPHHLPWIRSASVTAPRRVPSPSRIRQAVRARPGTSLLPSWPLSGRRLVLRRRRGIPCGCPRRRPPRDRSALSSSSSQRSGSTAIGASERRRLDHRWHESVPCPRRESLAPVRVVVTLLCRPRDEPFYTRRPEDPTSALPGTSTPRVSKATPDFF